MLAISCYALDEELPSGLSPVAETVFTLVKPTLDSANKKSANQSQGTRKRVTNDLQSVHKKEREGEIEVEIEKENECYISPLPPSGAKEKQKDLFSEFANGDTKLLAALTAFDQMRTRIKKPMTERAKELLLAKLQTFPSRDWTAILDQSVMSCWQGIFPLGGDKAQRTASEPKTFTELLQEAQHGY